MDDMTPEDLREYIKSWEDFFNKKFNPLYYGVFKKHGISKDAALIAFSMNKMENILYEAIAGDEEEDGSS